MRPVSSSCATISAAVGSLKLGRPWLTTVTERELLASVWETTRDRAVLLITHRLVEMEEMDEILVMAAGRVVERGTHEELTRADGLYRRMLETQRELLAESHAS